MPEPPERLGRRIAVLGGGGKTTLARALARAVGVPHIELDALFWKPGWEQRESDDFRRLVAAALADAGQGWVCDGNYLSRLGDLALAQADTVILVNMPWRVMFRRTLVRGVADAWSGRPVCGSNHETWGHLLSRESLIVWHLRYRREYPDRPRRVRDLTPTPTRWIQLDTPRQLDELYARFGLGRSSTSSTPKARPRQPS